MSAGRFSETISPKCGNAGHFRPAMQKSCRTILLENLRKYLERILKVPAKPLTARVYKKW
ncbi:Uncharacterized protein dnm_078210 [Desulfonema magnum]|uniref:Uncharacterized protein n=1 Tax=Desulfonema magnum TaxID=45655 RepID=A0A975BUU3_9BACT|nr:Uncharacterized protein dnm_078210 [Desulfonema magnum]